MERMKPALLIQENYVLFLHTVPAPGTLVPSAGIIIYEGRTLSKRVNQKGGSDGRETKKRGDQAAGT